MSFLSDSNEIAARLHQKKQSRHGAPEGFMRIGDVGKMLAVGACTLYRRMDPKSKYYDPTFPLPFKISPHNIAWKRSEIEQWMANWQRATYGEIAK